LRENSIEDVNTSSIKV